MFRLVEASEEYSRGDSIDLDNSRVFLPIHIALVLFEENRYSPSVPTAL